MNFLGLYNLIAALAVAGGTCGACGGSDRGPGPFVDPSSLAALYAAPLSDPGDSLPPPGYVINAPLSGVDDAAQANFWWNRQDNDQDQQADSGSDYSSSYDRDDPRGYAAPTNYGYAGGYYAGSAGDYGGGGYGQRPAHARRVSHQRTAHRDAGHRRNTSYRVHGHETAGHHLSADAGYDRQER